MRRDVAIVGGGIFGLAVARALVARGLIDVVVVEQAQCATGATGASGGMIRAFHLDAELCDLGARSMAAWAALTARHPGVFQRTGAMQVFSAAAGGGVPALAARLRDAGHDVRVLERDLASVCPGLRRDAGYVGVFEPVGGFVDPRVVCGLWERELRAAGVLFAEWTRVTAVEPGAPHRLVTDRGAIEARAVVVATGAWARELAPVDAAAAHYARPIQFAWLRPKEALSWPSLIDHESDFYFRPDGGAVLAGLPMRHRANLERPEAGAPEADHAARIAAFAGAVLAGLEGATVVGGRRSFDGYRAEGRPSAGRWDNGLYYFLGGSGGGLKLAPAIAEDLAAHVAGGV
jgi:glycine/D-amino acid oxidase-like deaminating enzyme